MKTRNYLDHLNIFSAFEDSSEMSAIDAEGKVTHEEFGFRGSLFVIDDDLLILLELGQDSN